MLRLLRLCLPVLVVACAAPAALAQITNIYTPYQTTYPSLLGTDGNLYGTGAGGMFELNLSTNAYSTVNASLPGLTLCSIAPDGTFLGMNDGSVVKVTMQGVVSMLAPVAENCPVLANNGDYYAGASAGGTYNKGYLYQITPAGVVTVLYNFTGGVDGVGPTTTLLQGSDGNLYGIGSGVDDEMFRFSATDGLTAFSSTAGITGPIYEDSKGDFAAFNGSSLDTITPQGAVTPLELNLSSNDSQVGNSNGNVYIGGSGVLYLEENYYYDNGVCGQGTFLTVYAVDPVAGTLVTLYSIGSDESGDDGSDSYNIQEFVAGNGNLYGGYSDTTISPQDDYCQSSGTTYQIYEVAAGTPAVEMGLSANHILPGKSTTLTWAATSAFSDNLQQCYGYNGLSGKVTASGSQILTFPNAGTYTPAVVCGGTQTGIAQVVVGDTQLVLSATPSAAVYKGQSVTLTASVVNPGTPSPTGKVQFLYGGRVLATSNLNSQGMATLTASTASLATGNYPITAKYAGDSNYAAATSAPLTVSVEPLPPTTTTLTTSTPSVVGGQTAKFTAGVSSSNSFGNGPTGSVTLYLGAQALLTAKLTPNYPDSTAALSASTAGVAPGSYRVTAKYSGNAQNAPSTSAAVTVTVLAGDTVTVSATPNPVPAGSSFTLNATVTGNSGTPTGTVIFSAGSQELAGANLNGSGVASATIPAGMLTAGTYSITAAYAGDSKNPSGTSAAYSLTVE